MFITPAYAQAAGGTADLFTSFLMPLLLILPIFYFFLIRPQRQQMKARAEMLSNIRRGDTIVTAGGFTGKVTKVIDDNDLEMELAKDVRVRVVRSYISSVRSKNEPVNDNPKATAKK
jgi:preprotein translocase subunit YajC